jgi:hypothetical protein
MGGSKRYPKFYAKQLDDRIEEFVMREELIMLTAAELDVDNTVPKDFPKPRRVYAWIRYPSKAIRVQAHAVSYTHTAVRIRFLEPMIKIPREGWVWLGMAERRHARSRRTRQRAQRLTGRVTASCLVAVPTGHRKVAADPRGVRDRAVGLQHETPNKGSIATVRPVETGPHLLPTRARLKLPTLRCLSRTHVNSRNHSPACTHPPRH